MLKRLLPALSLVFLLLPLQSISAVQYVTGSATVGNTLQNGTTSYSLEYSYPAVAQVGQNLTIQATLHVNQFSGELEYIAAYALLAQVVIGGYALSANATVAAGPNYLYPGGSWGPENLTVPLTAADTGIPKGSSENASVSITLSDYVYVGLPFLTYVTEPPMQGNAGTLVIENGVQTSSSTSVQSVSPGSAYIAYALLASGVVLMVVAAVLPRRPAPPRAQP